MLVFNTGVRVTFIGRPLYDALQAAAIASVGEGFDVYVTSIQDRMHGASSLHPFGLAVDLGVEKNDTLKLEKLYSWMTRQLPIEYDVIFEDNHVHVEYDTKRPKKDATAPASK